MLQGALGLLAAMRSGNANDEDYVAWGRRANMDAIVHATGEVADRFRDDDALEDALQAPFVVAHVSSMREAMRVAVAGAAGRNRHAVAGTEFPARFSAFALGFATGLVIGHRAKAAEIPIERLPKRTLEACLDWGAQVALVYLVVVEAVGIFGKAVDRNEHGISDHWRSLASARTLEPNEALKRCIQAGRAAGARWSTGHAVDLGAALAVCLPTERLAAQL